MQLRRILSRDRADFHTQAATGGGMPHHGFGANLSFLNKKMKIQHLALAFAGPRFQEKARRTEITNAGYIAAGGRFPVNPNIICDGDARRSPAGGAGCDLHRAHRLHPVPLEVFSPGLLRATREQERDFRRPLNWKSTGDYWRMWKLVSR